jgi:hypothetical protein
MNLQDLGTWLSDLRRKPCTLRNTGPLYFK